MNFYEEFGLSRSASSEEIRQAHKNLARLLHPDRCQDETVRPLAERQMQRVNAIFTLLEDPEQRSRYDQSLTGPSDIGDSGSTPPAGLLRRNQAWVLAVIAGLAGLYWLSAAGAGPDPVRPELTALPSKLEPVPPRPASSKRNGRGNPPPALAQEPRGEIEQLRRERDAALAQLARLKTADESRSQQPPAPDPASLTPVPAAEMLTSPKLFASAKPTLSGAWFYLAKAASENPKDLYPPEYIEVTVAERDGGLQGRYRGRYRVADRALSPEVMFQFAGRAGSGRYQWTGNHGSQGEIELVLQADGTLSVNWFSTQLGRHAALTSGTAVLVRRRDP